MRRPYCFSLMIASPADLENERNLIEIICNEWNSTFGMEKDVMIECNRWEFNLKSDSRKSPSQLVKEQFIENGDIFIAIFKRRIGTPNESGLSGTLDEIKEISSLNKPFFIYFMQSDSEKINLDEIDTNQIKDLQLFRKDLKEKNVSFKDISGNDELRKSLNQDLNFHAKELIKEYTNSDENTSKENSNSNNTNWFELSISELINKYLIENNQGVAYYKRGITFLENSLLWNSIPNINHKALVQSATMAREWAFDIKYGDYDYSKDLRSKYKFWYKSIHEILEKNNFDYINKSIVGVGSNNGKELAEIFQNKSDTLSLFVLDLSDNAIIKGKNEFPKIKFIKGNMEESPLNVSDFDLYLNLRSIHSSGIDFKLAIADAYRILKPGGMAIISVSDGYLTPKMNINDDLIEIKGLYDNRTEIFSIHRPYEFARKIFSKLIDYGFKNPTIITGDTEIFISAIK